MAIETLNVDGVEMKVTDLAPEIQRLIVTYEAASAKRGEAEQTYIMMSAALKTLSADITNAIQASKPAQDEAVPEVEE